jgi:hypothetical protein
METNREKTKVPKKIKKRWWDSILVGALMGLAFAVIIMRLTGYWPCEIISSLNIEQIISCSKSPQENIQGIYTTIQQSGSSVIGWLGQALGLVAPLHPHWLSQFLQNI